jgi:hypothetical protein
MGVKFRTSAPGAVTAIRFYKGVQNIGTHVGHLWTSTGTLLSSATFSNETASGWQQVNLPSPVTLTPGTSYIVSYHTNGFYSADPSFFATALLNGPLSAPASSPSAGNGVYAYGQAGTFPSGTFNSTNYWVDLSFLPSSTLAPAPVIDAKAFGDQASPSSTLMTAAFSTSSANQLLLAYVATDYLSGANTTVTNVTGAGLNWVLVLRTTPSLGPFPPDKPSSTRTWLPPGTLIGSRCRIVPPLGVAPRSPSTIRLPIQTASTSVSAKSCQPSSPGRYFTPD